MPSSNDEWIPKQAGDMVVKALALIVAAGDIVLLAMPYGWQIKTTQIWSFYLGLWNVQAKLDTLLGGGGRALLRSVSQSPEFVSKFTATLEGDGKSIQQFRDQFCNVEILAGGLFNNCQVWQQLLWGSYLAILALVVAILCNLFGVAFMFMAPTRCSRMSCLILFSVAGFVSLAGLAGYMCLSLALKEWLVALLLSSPSITWGPLCMVAVVLALTNAAIPIVLMFCGVFPRKKRADGYDSDSGSSYSEDGGYQQSVMGSQPPGYGAVDYNQGYNPQQPGYQQPGYAQPGMQQPGYYPPQPY